MLLHVTSMQNCISDHPPSIICLPGIWFHGGAKKHRKTKGLLEFTDQNCGKNSRELDHPQTEILKIRLDFFFQTSIKKSPPSPKQHKRASECKFCSYPCLMYSPTEIQMDSWLCSYNTQSRTEKQRLSSHLLLSAWMKMRKWASSARKRSSLC